MSNSQLKEKRTIYTIPNLICIMRLVGSIGLVILAYYGLSLWLLIYFVGLTLSDWIDGKLAIWLDQKSSFGARLDSVADFAMYAMLLVSGWVLKAPVLWNEWPWLVTVLTTYIVACVFCWLKFSKLPSYHTGSAKVSWFLLLIGIVTLLLDWSTLPFRIALSFVTLTNIESIAISLVLTHWQTDVYSLWHALKQKQRI